MIRGWMRALRDLWTRRAARELLAWHARAAGLVQSCQEAMRPRDMPVDRVARLGRMDWALDHLRAHASAVRRPLRRHDRALSDRLERATDQAVVLRNQMASFFIRWQSHHEAEQEGAPGAYVFRREWEEALLEARRTARALAAELDALGPPLEDLARRWSERPRG